MMATTDDDNLLPLCSCDLGSCKSQPGRRCGWLGDPDPDANLLSVSKLTEAERRAGARRLLDLERAVIEWEREHKRGRRGRGRKNGEDLVCATCPLRDSPKETPPGSR